MAGRRNAKAEASVKAATPANISETRVYGSPLAIRCCAISTRLSVHSIEPAISATCMLRATHLLGTASSTGKTTQSATSAHWEARRKCAASNAKLITMGKIPSAIFINTPLVPVTAVTGITD